MQHCISSCLLRNTYDRHEKLTEINVLTLIVRNSISQYNIAIVEVQSRPIFYVTRTELDQMVVLYLDNILVTA